MDGTRYRKRIALLLIGGLALTAVAASWLPGTERYLASLFPRILACDDRQALDVAARVVAGRISGRADQLIVRPTAVLGEQNGWLRCAVLVSEKGRATAARPFEMLARLNSDATNVVVTVRPAT